MATTRGRQVVIPMTNKSGGSVAAGDVVVIDTSNDTAFTTTTTGRAEVSLGVAQETIANNGTGRVLIHGYAALVNVPASVTRGHYIETHTVVKQATGNSTRRSGSFGQFLTGGTTPTGWLWGQTDQTSSGSGTTYGQTPPYLSSPSGDDDHMTATTNWTDVSAFDTKEILDSTILHLLTTGASKDNKVRFGLGTTRAGAFDYRWGGVVFGATHWSAQYDTYLELALKTSADAYIAMMAIRMDNTISGTQVLGVGSTSLATQTTISRAPTPRGTPWTLRVTRDGSNNLLFFYGLGTAPPALVEVQLTSNNTAYTVSSSGTVARAEILIHTPSGPSAGQHRCHAYIDYFEDAS